jgi:hypothetical protein
LSVESESPGQSGFSRGFRKPYAPDRCFRWRAELVAPGAISESQQMRPVADGISKYFSQCLLHPDGMVSAGPLMLRVSEGVKI